MRLRVASLITTPPLVWASQGLLGWYVASNGCPERFMALRMSTVRLLMAIVSIGALGAAIVGVVDAARLVRTSPSSAPGDIDRVQFFGTVALVIGGTLSLGILFASLPSIFITRCAGSE